MAAEAFPILPLLALSCAGCTRPEKGKEGTAVLEIYMILGLDLLEINLFCYKNAKRPWQQTEN